MRLFLGTYLRSEKFLEHYRTLKMQLEMDCQGKWVEPENLHFTYHFIGEANQEQFNEIKSELGDLFREYESEITLKGLDVFPNRRAPRVLHIPVVNPDGKVAELYSESGKVLTRLGFELDKRPYSPHLTLARLNFCSPNELNATLERYANFEFITAPAFTFNLIESRLTRKGPIYTPLL